MHTASTGDQADPRLRQSEYSIFGSNYDVAGKCRLEPTAHGDSIHRRDQRLREIETVTDTGKAARPVRAALAASLDLQVVAGRESPFPGPGDDADPQVIAGSEFIPYGGQFIVGVGMKRVKDLRTIESDNPETAFILDSAILV